MNIIITNNAINQIKDFFSNSSCERGGIIGKNRRGIITTFCPDIIPEMATKFSYAPNIKYLERIINNVWQNENIEFAGFVHSHMNNAVLSETDILYIRKIIDVNKIQCLICGIFGINNEPEKKLQCYNISKDSIELLHIKTVECGDYDAP